MEKPGYADKTERKVSEMRIGGEEQNVERRPVHSVQDLAQWGRGTTKVVRQYVAQGLDPDAEQTEGQDGDGLQQETLSVVEGLALVASLQGAFIPGQAEVTHLRTDPIPLGTQSQSLRIRHMAQTHLIAQGPLGVRAIRPGEQQDHDDGIVGAGPVEVSAGIRGA